MVGSDEGLPVLEAPLLDLSRALCISKYLLSAIVGRRLGLHSRWKWPLTYLGRHLSHNPPPLSCHSPGGGPFPSETHLHNVPSVTPSKPRACPRCSQTLRSASCKEQKPLSNLTVIHSSGRGLGRRREASSPPSCSNLQTPQISWGKNLL